MDYIYLIEESSDELYRTITSNEPINKGDKIRIRGDEFIVVNKVHCLMPMADIYEKDYCILYLEVCEG